MKTLILTCTLASAAFAQDLSDVFPALKTLPAPPSIQEGMRYNYYGSAGDIPNDDYAKWTGNDGTWDYATAPSGHRVEQRREHD